MNRYANFSTLRLANDGFEAIFRCLENGRYEVAFEVADALRNLPEGAGDDAARHDLLLTNLCDLVARHPDEPAIQALKQYVPTKLLIRPL